MQKEKIRRALVTKEEKRLVSKSDIVKKYPELEFILTLDDRAIYEKDIQSLKTHNKGLYDIIFHGFKEINDVASKEWYQAGYLGNYKAICELCGNPLLTHVYKIVNKFNGNSLKVGSECIYKFKNMDKKISGIDIKQYSRLLVKNDTKRIERIIKFNNRYPQGKEIIQSWKDVHNEFDLIVPKEIDDDFIKLFSDSAKFYKDFISGKMEEEKLERFNFNIKEYDYRIEKYHKFREENINNIFSCNKTIKQWLLDNGQENIVEIIASCNGRITKDTAKYVYCEEFINRFEDIIKLQFNNHKISLVKIDSSNITFKYKYKTHNYIELQLTLKEFAERFLFLFCSRKVQLERGYIISNMKIKNSYFDVNEYMGICSNILKKSNLSFKFDEEFYRRQDIEIKDRVQKKYTVTNVIKFINQNIEILFKDELESESILMSSINNIKKWDDLANKKKFSVSEKDISSIYKNKTYDD